MSVRFVDVTEARKRRYYKKKSEGICVSCIKKAIKGKIYCRYHRDRSNQHWRKSKNKFIKEQIEQNKIDMKNKKYVSDREMIQIMKKLKLGSGYLFDNGIDVFKIIKLRKSER